MREARWQGERGEEAGWEMRRGEAMACAADFWRGRCAPTVFIDVAKLNDVLDVSFVHLTALGGTGLEQLQ